MVHADRQECARRGTDCAAGGLGCAGRLCASQEPQELRRARSLVRAECSIDRISSSLSLRAEGPRRAPPPRVGNLRALFMKGCHASRASSSFLFLCFPAVLIGWISRAARRDLRKGCSTLNDLFFVVVSSSSSRSRTGGGLIRPTYSFVNNCLPGATGTSPAATRSRPVRTAQLRRGLKPARQGP